MVGSDIVVGRTKDLTNRAESVKRGFAKYLDKERINEVIGGMRMGRERMLLTFLWMSGVRVSEAVSVCKQDLDFEQRLMSVKWLKSRKYLRRVVPIHSRLSGVLQVYVSRMREEERVFPVTRQRAFQITKRYLGCSPHQLRHSFAVNWLRGGGDLVVLHRVLGHAKIQTTMEYLKIVPIDQAKALEKIEFW